MESGQVGQFIEEDLIYSDCGVRSRLYYNFLFSGAGSYLGG